jgi:Gas vesicle protein
MEPQRESRATMTDLVERVIDKGVVVKLELVVGVAGIPLIGISLQAAIAAVETMLRYGMMEDWDSRTRACADRDGGWRQLALWPGEQVQLEVYGSYRQTEGICRVWRPGRLLLTDQRLLLIRPLPQEVLFAAQVSDIVGVGRVAREIDGGGRDVICLALEDGTLAALYTAQADVLEACLAERLGRLGRAVTELSPADVGSLGLGAVAAGQMWHRWQPRDGRPQWKSGWAVLTADELTWRADVGPDALLRVPLAQIEDLAVDRRDLGSIGVRDVLAVRYGAGTAEALFIGEEIGDWPAAIQRAADPGGDGDGNA